MKHAKDEASKLANFDCVGFIGPWASDSSMEVFKLLSVPSINRGMIGYSASSPQLSTDGFSNYVRANPGVQTKVELVVELIKGVSFCEAQLDCVLK